MNQFVLSSLQTLSESLSWRDWVIIAVIILFSALILFLLLRPLFLRRKMKKMNQQASAQQQQDLQAWQNIAAMSKDTDNGVKQSLSSQLRNIRTLFQQGLEMLKKTGRNRNSLPWFMILGEPQSGKSELLKTGDLSLKCSASEDAEGSSFPLRFWLGRALVLDISGRTFFDRWFDGSCAEWEYIRKLLLKFHGKVPLNGIILTIPADALIADSEELTRKKISLIATELNGLLSGIGMVLPCYVVVTKLDMILGFREYFLNCTETQNEKIFGWRNPEKNGFFDSGSFAAYFKDLKNKLHDRSLAQMLLADGDKARLDLTSGIYLFPDEFARIRRNLLLYLNTLFGRRSWIDSDCAKMAGVYFTAARCGHVMLSQEYAECRQQPVEEAALVNKQAGPQHAFFVKDLFDDLIFANGGSYAFTRTGRIRRNIKKYALCLLMAAASVWLALAAWNSQGRIRSLLEERCSYYEKTASYLDHGDLRQSPLVIATPKGEMTVCRNESLAKHPSVNRLMYFYESQQIPDKNSRVPWGFRASQLLLFHDFDCGQDQQDFVSSRIQMEMVLRPTLQILLKHLVSPKAEKERFDSVKRDVYLQLHHLSEALPDEHGRINSSPLQTSPYLRYLNPKLPEELVELLSYRAGRTSAGDLSVIAGIVYSLEYQKAVRALTRQFLNAWDDLAVEPHCNYEILRTAIRNAGLIRQNIEKIRKLAREIAAGSDKKQLMPRLASLVDQQNKLADSLAPVLASPNLLGVLQISTADPLKNGKAKLSIKRELTFQNVCAEYESKMEKDFALIRKNGSAAVSGKFPNAASEFNADMLEKMHQNVKRKFAIEKKELEDKLNELKNSQIFQPALLAQKDSPVKDTTPVIQVELEYLNMLVRTWKQQNIPMKSPAEFPERMQAVQADQTKLDKDLADYAKRYASNKTVADFIKDCRNFIQLRNFEMKDLLKRELFVLYPASAELLMSAVAKQSHLTSETLGMKAELAAESFGELKMNSSFDPQTALAYAVPIGMLLGDGKEKKEKDTVVPPDPELTRISKILDEYFALYIRFWGSFCDRIPLKFDSWTAFRSDSMKRKVYETNTLLLASYRNSCDFISRIPDEVLSKATANQKKLAVTQLNNRIQMLSPDFMQSCNRVCGAWAALPADANKAFGVLNALPQKQLRTDYLLVFDAKAKGDIPWWSKWVSCGVSLLFRDAKTQIFENFETYRPMIFSFPLCAKSPYPSVLGEPEMIKLSRYLASLGCPIPEAEPEAPAKKDSPGTPEKKDPPEAEKESAVSKLTPPDALEQLFGNRPESLKEWTLLGGRLQILIDAMTNKVKPLVYTLSIPAEAEQKNLSAQLEKPLPLAIYRFPWIRVSNKPNAENPRMFHLNGAAVPELLSGAAADPQIYLEFNSFSDSASPDCTVSVASDWAILRLYLSDLSGFDPKTRKAYSALKLKDKTGKSYLLWLEFKFNKALPLPSDWPSVENCPDFSQIQSNIRKNISTESDWIQTIRMAETGDKGYCSLRGAIRQHSTGTFPACSFIADSMQKTVLEMPYLELETPNKVTRVFCSGKTKQIPLALTENRLDIRMFRFSDDKSPAYSCTIPGPFALLRLLTAEKRKFEKSFLLVPVKLTSKDGRKNRELVLKIQLGR